MHIKRLYIGDFGIYQNETLEDLNNGLVVIGGLNRAGKSTLLKVLKNLSYGFVKGETLPPPRIQYNVEGTLENDDMIYNLKLEGYKKPLIVPNFEGLLYPIDKNSYSELFTIDLDVLKGIDTLLLGAGFKDVIKIPAIIKELKRESEKIGGKVGNPNTKQFKPFFNSISKGLKEREVALKEKDIYLEKNEKLMEIDKKINESSIGRVNIEKDLSKLELVFNNYKDYIKLLNLEEQIKNKEGILEKYGNFSLERVELFKREYGSLKENLKEKALLYENLLKGEKIHKKGLLNNLEDLERLNKEMYGIKEKYVSLEELQGENIKERENIIGVIKGLNEDLNGDLNLILGLKCDYLGLSEIENLLQRHEELYDSEKKGLNIKSRNLWYTLLGGVTLLSSLMVITNVTNLIYRCIFLLFQLGILGGFVYLIGRLKEQNFVGNKELEDIESKIEDFKNRIKLQRDVAGEGIILYARTLLGIKERINNLYIKEEKALFIKKELEGKKNIALEKINECYEIPIAPQGEASSINYIIEKIEKLIDIGNSIKEGQRAFTRVRDYEKDILKYFHLEEYGENLVELLESYCKNIKNCEELMTIINEKEKIIYRLKYSLLQENSGEEGIDKIKEFFGEYIKSYSTLEDIEKEIKRLHKEILELENALENLKEERAKTLLILENLGKSNSLEKIEMDILKSKAEMKPLADKYAIYNCASYILENAYNNFINKSKDNVLSEASNIFNKVTGGEYNKILPGENFLNMDFKAVSGENTINNSAETLSRGTKEQLFFSIRLSRILNISPLPVIIDDSLVNFDAQSLKSTLSFVKELSKRNQVFLLTCHSKVVETLSALNIDGQYFILNKGKLMKSRKESLIEYLK
ncbi:hypothetical protein GCM10008905_12520 [Clostridium malenominatum]|uniref:YhaN AAA domain-containing protein n=1 Tax=Clostridium malenominatum TaxID=1539 RepID=A0ABN1IUY9_9CLOT